MTKVDYECPYVNMQEIK